MEALIYLSVIKLMLYHNLVLESGPNFRWQYTWRPALV